MSGMRTRTPFAAVCILLLLPYLLATGCSSHPKSQVPQPVNTRDSAAVSERLRVIATTGMLAQLRWSNFSGYRQRVQQLYEAQNYQPVWLRDGQPTPQSLAMIAALEASEQKGLNPEDYDASRWPAWLSGFKTSSGNTDTVANFDAALTVNAMRYISDLHIGRVNPNHSEFGIAIQQNKYDLPQFVTQKILSGGNLPEALQTLEPQYYGYQRTEAALKTYLPPATNNLFAPEMAKNSPTETRISRMA